MSVGASALMVWVSVAGAVALWAALRTLAWSRRAPGVLRGANARGSVVVFRPCAGHEPWLERALASSASVPAPARIRCLVAHASDAARLPAEAVCASLQAAGRSARTLITEATGANRKASQLAAGYAAETLAMDVVMVADSDVLLDEDVAGALLAPMASGQAVPLAGRRNDDHADICVACPIEVGPVTTADFASAAVLDASMQAFSILSRLDSRGIVGKAFAIRRDALEAVGGFEALSRSLGEDMELARLLVRAGRKITYAAIPARSLASGRTWPAVFERYTRWLSVIRAQRPALLASYPLLIACGPLQLALGAAVWIGEGHALPFASAALVRTGVVLLAGLRSPRPLRHRLAFALVADVLLLAALVRAVSTRRIHWRGLALEIDGARIREGG